MVELGPAQAEENQSFAEEAAARVDHLVLVGKTNRGALQQGSANGKASVTVVDSRDEAVEWARANLGPGDAVLYENDLPDHYP
jgi:UDP-N-acetylmuramoyl-tripeptide--D-alanyl-D-alanine ligase